MTWKGVLQQYSFLQYIHAHKTYTSKQCAPIFWVHVCMYVCMYMNLGVHIHTIDELTLSNIGIAMDEILDNL